MRVDLDWVRNTLSAYLTGPHGAWLKAAYFLLSCALVLLGLAALAAGLQRAKLVMLPRCGHMPMFEKENEFVETVTEFCLK